MKILILAAMDKELQLLESLVDAPEIGTLEQEICGEINTHKVVIAKCGIGKVNSALNCYRLILAHNPDLVINSGVAGGAALPIGSLLVATEAAYDDVWCGPGTEYGQADGLPLFLKTDNDILIVAREKVPEAFFGLICTGDKFISTPEEIAFIKNKFPDVKAVDMESAAIGQTCCLNKIPFAVIRVVSDTPGEGENISQYKDFWQKAPEKTFHCIKTIINNLK